MLSFLGRLVSCIFCFVYLFCVYPKKGGGGARGWFLSFFQALFVRFSFCGFFFQFVFLNWIYLVPFWTIIFYFFCPFSGLFWAFFVYFFLLLTRDGFFYPFGDLFGPFSVSLYFFYLQKEFFELLATFFFGVPFLFLFL